MIMPEIEHYLTEDGKDIFQEYLDSMRDLRAHARILRRLDRVKLGNFGDHKQLSDDICELRIDVGQGYRVYYTFVDNKIVLLLCVGDKSSQSKDIKNALRYKQDYIANN